MSRKHFQALAYALMNARPESGPALEDRRAQWSMDCALVANVCAQSNQSFDRERFLAACEAESYSPARHGR